MTKVELEIEFSGGIFFPEIVDYMNLTVCRSGDLPPRTLTRTFQIAARLCLRRPSRLLPASARRKQAQYVSCPSRPASFVFGRCRCAPPPDPFRWACAQLASSHHCAPPQDRARLPERHQTIPGGFDAFSS